MQLRVVTDQPWDVKADVLVIPIVGDPTFEGPLDELDRRAGGELRALAGFKELTGKRYSTTLAASGELPAGRWSSSGRGRPPRSIARSSCASARRPSAGSGGRVVQQPGRLARPARRRGDRRRRRRRGRAGRPRRGRGLVRPEVDLPRRGRVGAAEARRADPRRARRRHGAPIQAAGERGVIIGEGANTARTLSNRAANDVSPEVLADEARAIAERNDLWIDVIEPERATELGMGMFMAVGRGSDNPPRMIVMRSGEEGRARLARPAPRDRRQGRLLRLGRHQHQAIRPDGRDEDGQDRRVHGHRRDGDGRAAGARARRCSASRRPSRTCPARIRPGPATSSRRSTARRSTSPTPTPRAG